MVVLAAMGLAVVQVARAGLAARRGQRALLDAVGQFTTARLSADELRGRLDRVRQDVTRARHDFSAMRHDLHTAGPALPIGRVLPFVRVQIKGVETLDTTGRELALSATQLVNATDAFVNPKDPNRPVADALGEVRQVHAAITGSRRVLDQVAVQVSTLNGLRLLGPLAHARAQLVARLPRLQSRVVGADQALGAFEVFAGGTSPRTYLVLSQNPDEPRPTGGFIGTYGVLTATGGHLSLDRYDAVENWYAAHPTAVVPESAAPTVFALAHSNQNLSNVNATPDWPRAAQLAARLWALGGEKPADGVVSFTPTFMARLVGVLGPVPVPSYGETVTATNLVGRVDYWTHQAAAPQAGGRKEFVSVLAEAVLHRMLGAPLSQWPALTEAAADGFRAQEAMAWVGDRPVQDALHAHGWDGTFPEASPGDFFADSEFAFVAKNGRSLQRVFDHELTLKADGSATAATTITVHDTEPPSPTNLNSHSYLTIYGPDNATLDPASDHPTEPNEPSAAGHPAAGWELSAPPLGSASLKVVWDVPLMITPLGPDRFALNLQWLRLPGHDGDVLRLHVTLPPRWRWESQPPPSSVPLTTNFSGTWIIEGPAG